MGSPRRDGQKQVSNSNLNRPLPSRADSPERGASGPSETDYVLASFSFSLLLFMSKVADNISIDPPKKI
jgi:hypothetical protein